MTSKAPRDPQVIEQITGVDDAEVIIAYVQAPDHRIELIQYLGPVDRGSVRPRPCDVGFVHVAFDVDDVGAAIAAAEAHEVRPINPPFLTDAGLNEFRNLLLSTVRTPFNDLNKLVVALKMRFLHLLDAPARRDQADMLVEACRSEYARLMDLRRKHADAGGHLIEWLDYDIGQVEDKLGWFRGLRERL